MINKPNFVDSCVCLFIFIFSIKFFCVMVEDIGKKLVKKIYKCKRKYTGKNLNAFINKLKKLNIESIIENNNLNSKKPIGTPPLKLTPYKDIDSDCDSDYDYDSDSVTDSPPPPPPTPQTPRTPLPPTPASSVSSTKSSTSLYTNTSDDNENEIETPEYDLRRSRRLRNLKPNYSGL